MFDNRLMALCPESRKYIIGNIIVQWLELCLNALMIMTVANLVQSLFDGTWTTSAMIQGFVVIAVTIVLRFFTTRMATRMSYCASRTVKQKLRDLIYGKLLNLGTGYREHTTTAALVQESVEGVDQLESYFGLYMPQFFYAFLAPLTLFFLFGFGGSWKVATVLLVAVPLIPGTIMMVQKIAKKILSKYWGQYTKLGSTFLENLQGMTTLKTYQADEFKNKQMNEESEHFRKVTMAVLTMQLNSVTIMDLIAYGGAALGILLATASFVKGQIGLSTCIFMILLSVEFFLPMRRLGSYFHVAMNGMAASDKIFKFLSEEEPKEKTAEAPSGDIVLKDVHFSYDKEREVLHGVDVNIRRGGFTAIVGESGSGKSTIASLLMGKYSIGSGSLCMGGTPISDISEKSLMKAITRVGNNSVFFKGTIKDNLLIADQNASDQQMWKVLEDCELASFLKQGKGLETELTENASNLSGGQRQRLALARAILHDSPIYIFDEATSNIDIESEEAILRQIHDLAKTRTVIMISHRLANVVEADAIYCMEDGIIAEYGKHDELLSKDGTYARLWVTQRNLEMFGKEAM